LIVCPNCTKENQDHYKFCLGCGAKLPEKPAYAGARPAVPPQGVGYPPPAAGYPAPPAATGYPAPPATGYAAPMPHRPAPSNMPTSVAAPNRGSPAVASPSGFPAAAPPAASIGSGVCGSCGMNNPPGFAFCGRCGAKLIGVPSTAADVGSARTMFVDETPKQKTNAPQAVQLHRARLTLLGPDGNPVGTLPIEGGPIEIGRSYGPPFDDDAYLNPRHAAFTVRVDGVTIDDFASQNGVFVKLKGRIDLQHGDQFRVGQELLLYEDIPEPAPTADGTEKMGSPNAGYWGRVSVIIDPGHASMSFPIIDEAIQIGREIGDITFPNDGYVSGKHCRVVGTDDGVFLEDLGSSNGTYVRLRSGAKVPFGALLLIGQKLFLLEPG